MISTRRSRRSGGGGATCQSESRTRQQLGQGAGLELGLPLAASLEELEPRRVQLAVELRDELERFRAENVRVCGGEELGGAQDRVNWASSVEPESASVELSPECLEQRVEVAGADLALVARRRVAALLEVELPLLELDVGGHAARRVAVCELEHRLVERVEAGQRDELELVAELAQLVLEARDLPLLEVAAPVERGRAVVGEQLAGIELVDRLGVLARLAYVGRRGLEPEDVRVRRAGERTRDRRLEAGPDAEEAFRCPLPGEELLVGRVDVARQERRAQRVRAGDEHGRDAGDVGCQPGRGERADELGRRDEHLAAQVTALLLRRELILVVDAGRAGLDHRPHQLVCLEWAAEACLGVGDDREQPVDVPSLDRLDLAGAQQRVVQPADECGRAVGRVEALVGIRLPGEVRVRGDLPAGQVNRFQAGLCHLHRLAAGQGAESGDVIIALEELPEAFGATAGKRVLDVDRAAEALDVLVGIRALDSAPALGRIAVLRAHQGVSRCRGRARSSPGMCKERARRC